MIALDLLKSSDCSGYNLFLLLIFFARIVMLNVILGLGHAFPTRCFVLWWTSDCGT
jgi:hypothetical protein